MSDRAQTIFRVEKNADNPFVMIDRRVIENPKLSWKAKGLLAYLLSRPDNWVVRFKDLVKRSPDGGHTVRVAMKELKDAGHVKITTEREGGRVVRWVYTVHESPDVEFQQVEIQEVEKQQVENRTFNNKKDSTKKESTKKKLIINSTLQLFVDTLGKFYGELEKNRWTVLYDSVGPARAKELVNWAFKKEIHLLNRASLLDSLETAAKNWQAKPTQSGKTSKRNRGDGNHRKYIEGEYANYIEH